jgi:hypothetical protein
MRRREFISLIGCGAATWPLAARAQQTDRMRRLGMLMVGDENDALRGAKGWFARFTQGLAELGWTDGRNLRMDVRWVGDSVDRARIYAKRIGRPAIRVGSPRRRAKHVSIRIPTFLSLTFCCAENRLQPRRGCSHPCCRRLR